MRGYIAAVCTAMIIFSGSCTAYADTLWLPRGERLDLGPNIHVWRGRETFLGRQAGKWIFDPSAEEKLSEGIEKAKLYPKENAGASKELAKAVMKLLRQTELYQLRAEEKGVLYTSFVLSLPSQDGEFTEIAEETALFDAGGNKEGQTKGSLLADRGLLYGSLVRLQHRGAEDKGQSAGGVRYTMSSAYMSVEIDGLSIPLYVATIDTEKENRHTYTVVVADPESGRYFDKVWRNALKGAES